MGGISVCRVMLERAYQGAGTARERQRGMKVSNEVVHGAEAEGE